MARQNEADRRAKTYPSGTVGTITKSDTTVIVPICSVLFINCTVAGNVAVRMLDGNTAVLPVPTGITVLELQYDMVLSTLTTATATFVGLYNL